MHGKTFYKNMGLTHFVAMLLFIIVFYIGLIMRHWLTFDAGLFGAIIACISTIYNVTKYENVKIIEKQLGYSIEELIAIEKADEQKDEEGEEEENEKDEDLIEAYEI